MVSHSANQQTIEVASHMHTWSCSKRNGSFWIVLLFAFFGMWSKRNVPFLQHAWFGMALLGLCSYVLFLEWDQNGMCLFCNVLDLEFALLECAPNGMCPFWNFAICTFWNVLQMWFKRNVLFLESALFGMRSKQNVLFWNTVFPHIVAAATILYWNCKTLKNSYSFHISFSLL